MSKKYIFGLTAKEAQNQNESDFHVDYDDNVNNYNPYSKEQIKGIPCNTNREELITSIPSPYARMHVTELAFVELLEGRTLLRNINQVTDNDISPDYSRALSHCLDIFELLYHSDDIDLQEIGVTVEKINLARPQGDPNSNLYKYLETLQLFRDQYMRNIRGKMKAGNINDQQYTFDFSSLYVFKYKGKTFAATSPFTGFFAKQDCDLTGAGIKLKDNNGNERTALTNSASDWRDMKGRPDDFKRFMYLLLNENGTKLGCIFKNLFAVVSESLTQNERDRLKNSHFDQMPEYRKFNTNVETLQRIGSFEDQPLFIRPDNIDSSYLKFLLYYRTQPANLSIKETDYTKDLKDRRFNGKPCRWLGPNDILSDALFILPYEVNENYLSVSYTDDGNTIHKNCVLLPIKSGGLKHFGQLLGEKRYSLSDYIIIYKKTDDTFLVKMTIPLENGGTTTIRREYKNNEARYPNGCVMTGDKTSPFAFGIYPFVKTSLFENIYKVLFYHHFDPRSNDKSKLKFYYVDNDAVKMIEFSADVDDGAQSDVQSNQTVMASSDLPGNSWYYHIEAKTHGIDIVEVCSDKGTALIVPKLKRVQEKRGIEAEDGGDDVITMLPNEVIISVDLGTSNTYVAYMVKNPDNVFEKPQEISTVHGTGNRQWSELMFMHKTCTRTEYVNAIDKNRSDLYLKTPNGSYSDTWLATQLCEYIPSKIVPRGSEADGYSFPIPSVINQTYVNGEKPKGDEVKIPLFNSAIPFAYYEIGKRMGDYDTITEGKFKWFRIKKKGNFTTLKDRERAFRSFVKELLLLFRSNLISEGYRPENTKLIWTYPLSFAPELRKQHAKIWEEEYKACFKTDPKGKVLYTNESRAPIYECIQDLNQVNRLTLLMDVGGGSTDVFGFKSNEPKFSTSFSFAGNALYLDGDLNQDERTQQKYNVMRAQVQRDECAEVLNAKSPLSNTELIRNNASISAIMNYGFSKEPNIFESVFENEDPKFLLKFHNWALIYHIAQLCKIKSPDEGPVALYLTGNGRKLFDLYDNSKAFIKSIFEEVYGDKFYKDMAVTMQDDPKATTARGALKAYSNNFGDEDIPGLAYDGNDVIAQVVMLGDEINTYDTTPEHGGASITVDTKMKDAVEKNVKKYIDMFFKLYNHPNPRIKADKVKEFIDDVRNNDKLKQTGGVLSESIFFQYIALIMEQISKYFIEHQH